MSIEARDGSQRTLESTFCKYEAGLCPFLQLLKLGGSVSVLQGQILIDLVPYVLGIRLEKAG